MEQIHYRRLLTVEHIINWLNDVNLQGIEIVCASANMKILKEAPDCYYVLTDPDVKNGVHALFTHGVHGSDLQSYVNMLPDEKIDIHFRWSQFYLSPYYSASLKP